MKVTCQHKKSARRYVQFGLAAVFTYLYAAPAVAETEAPAVATSIAEAVSLGKPMTSFRLRYEHVDQDGLTEANGLTLRSLIGWQTVPLHDVSLAVQLINVTQLEDNFNDSVPYRGPIHSYSNQPGKAAYAKIVDPDYTDVNQLYLDIHAIDKTRVRLGRQQVNLDNVRFIGDIGFRQLMQVFDGVSILNKSVSDTEIYLAHFESVRQINTALRTDGALEVANIKYRFSPTESVTAYGYFSSFDNLGYGKAWFGAGNDNSDQSNQVIGLRLDGAHKFNDDWKLLYTAEYAKQQDYSGGDSRIDAHYYKLGAGTGYGNFSLRADQELLSSNNSKYAFQTPFGTNHLFQGWVDKFLSTPKEGIRDTFVTATYKFSDFAFFADYHWLDSDTKFNQIGGGRGDQYGTEWNAAATYNYSKNILTKVEYGKYSERDQYIATASRIRDTEKIWLTIMYSF